jgi:Glycosyl hydrolases family 39
MPSAAPTPMPETGPPGTIRISGPTSAGRATRVGENYWCWSNYGNQIAGTEGLVAPLRLRVLRAGGHNNDSNSSNGFDPFDGPQIDRFVAYARSVGAEPILQAPLLRNARGGMASPRDAGDMVRYCNQTKGYGIRYWEIGNEPDLYADQGDVPGYDVDRFCNDFNAFSAEMKRVDPGIQILGPELSWRYYPQSGANDWLTPFLSRCRRSFDIVAIHRYPFAAKDSTIANAMADVASFKSLVRSVRTLMDSNGLASTPLAVTEANISWDGAPESSTQSASPQTFYAGLWLADTLGAAIQQRLWAICYWSLSEGWTLGMIDPVAKTPRPSYYALQMVTNHAGPTLLDAAAPAGFSVYASRSADERATVLVVINKNATTNLETVLFADPAPGTGGPYSHDFPAYSLSVLSLPDDATPMKVWSYTKAMADAGSPPQQTQ